ncbi:methyl-accepting chemotaxis protein [Metabacillus litoralis]|uniref:Methyl-accepting chemotaxis protein n=1 Tax=Metabacillus litoralis TaxID=152268 RepID=A0A5C6VWJ1_9BACI|nr:methyl-accepting chemotaxis protein [Metabacillus litoralis]TXC89329.1 methyl-accepting chemotaxis protein [Metabacillus litoralis]
MKQLLFPAIKLMNRLTFSKKFLLLFLVIFLTVGMLVGNVILKINSELAFVKKEQTGTELLSELYPLIQLTQKHRGLTVNVISGDKSAESDLQEVRKQLNLQLDKVQKQLKKKENVALLHVNEGYKDVISEWKTTEENTISMSVKDSVTQHNHLIAMMFSMLLDIADETNLTLDSDLVNNHINNLLVNTLPQITEFMGKSRAVGVGVATKQTMTEDERIELIYLMKMMDEYIITAERTYDTAFELQPTLKDEVGPYVSKSISEAKNIVEIINQDLLGVTNITIKPKDYFEKTTNTINSIYELLAYQTETLNKLLDKKVSSLSFERVILISIVVFVMFLLIYLLMGFYFGVQDQVRRIQEATKQVAEKDLTKNLTVSSKDEFGQISQSLNTMIFSVREVINSSQQVSQEVASSSQELLAITEESAQATNQITSAVEEVAMIAEQQNQQSKENVQLAEQLTHQLSAISAITAEVSAKSTLSAEEAESGNKNVNETVLQMKVIQDAVKRTSAVIQRLGERSNEIGSILDAITSIAQQTNLLSLNAAIEAARAGEHGKGFAVVAGEVKKLAEESSLSANKIREIIEEIQTDTKQSMGSMDRVSLETNEGMNLVEKTGVSFSHIFTSTKKVADEVHEVARSAKLMLSQIDQLSNSIMEAAKQSEVTEDSTQSVAASTEEQLASMEEITSSANELSSRAQQLHDIVEEFKL